MIKTLGVILPLFLAAVSLAAEKPPRVLPRDPGGQSAAAARTWQLVNPGGGGQIQDVRADPNTPDVLYASSDMEGGYRTRDGGLSWQHITYGTSHSMAFFVEAEPGNSDRLYCGHILGLDISDDGGRTWKLHSAFGNRSVGTIAINPRNPAEVYVGHSWRGKGARYNQTTIGPRVIHVSKDRGRTFRAIRYEAVDGVQQIEDILIDPANPQVVLLGGHAGIYRSADGGETWAKIPVPVTHPPVPEVERAAASNARSGGGAIALSADGRFLYACFNNKQVFAARVGEWEWHEITEAGFKGRLVPILRVSPYAVAAPTGGTQDRLYVGTEPGSGPREALVTWPDAGRPTATWREAASLATIGDHGVYQNYVLWSYGFAFAPKSWKRGEQVWISGGHALYFADIAAPDYPRNWVERYSRPVGRTGTGAPTYRTRGFDNVYLWEIEKHGRYVVQALADMFMFESYDGGESWVWTKRTAIGLQQAGGNRGYSAEIIRTEPALVLVCAVGELIAKSLVHYDARDPWKVIGGGLVPRNAGRNRQGPGDENRMGAPGTRAAAAARAPQAAESAPAPVTIPALNGLPAGPMQSIVSDPHQPRRVYIATAENGVYGIDDIVRLFETGEGRFTHLNAGTPFADGFIRSLAVDPLNADVLYALCTGTSIEEDPTWTWTGVWKGVRQGGQWSWKRTLELERRLNSDLRATVVGGKTTVIVSGRPRVAGQERGTRSPDGQVFISHDQGETWQTSLTRDAALKLHPAAHVTPATEIEMTGLGAVDKHVFVSVIADEQKNGVSYLRGTIEADGSIAWSDFTDDFYYPRAYRTNVVQESGETWLYVATMGSGAFRRNITDLVGGKPGTAASPSQSSAAPAALKVQRHIYKQTGKRPLELACYLPDDWKPEDRRPAIIFYFGGGFWTSNVDQFARQAEYFARRGLVTILADYRAGEKDGTKPPAAFEDARSAFRWVRQHAARLGIDPQRIAAGGGSAGGSLAASLIVPQGLDGPGEDARISVRPDALLLYNPALGASLNERTLTRFGDEATWRKTVAAHHVDASMPPTLQLYGSKDNLVRSGREFASKLEGLKVRSEIEITPDVGHGFFNFSPHLADTTRRVDAFLQSLGWLQATPAVPLPEGSAALSESAGNPERGRP